MAVTFTIELPKGPDTRQKLEDIRRHLGIKGDEDAAEGMLMHLESETADGYRIVDIWESEAHLQRFFETRLGAAFAAAGFDPLQGGQPALENVINLVQRQRVAAYDAIVNDLYDAWTRNEPSVFDRYAADDFVEHERLPGAPAGIDGVKLVIGETHRAFEGLRMEALDIVSAPGRATARFRMTGKHVSEFMDIPATGRDISVEGIDGFAIGSDGLIHEHWGVFDQAGLMSQLGAVPQQAYPPSIALGDRSRV